MTRTRTALIAAVTWLVLLVILNGVVHAFWLLCGGLDIHAWPHHFICWYPVELMAGLSAVTGFVAGHSVRARGVAVIVSAGPAAFAAFGFQGGFPFGTDPFFHWSNAFVYVIAPCSFGGITGWYVANLRSKNAG